MTFKMWKEVKEKSLTDEQRSRIEENVKKELLLTVDDLADFTWDFGCHYFLETSKGNFIWSSPDYGGDNSIVPFNGTLSDYFKNSYGKERGRHIIKNYCGDGVKIKQ